jgi:DNA-binding CsgD family transcriptional regulator
VRDLPTSDLRALLGAAELVAGVESMPTLREVVAGLLLDLLPAERAGWVTIDRATGVMSGLHVPEMLPHLIPLMPRDLSQVPLVTELANAPEPTTLRISDVVPAAEWSASALCREVYRPWGGEFQIGSLVARDPGILETLAVFRADGDFTDDEVALVETFARTVRVVASRIRRVGDGDLGLTPRQRQVLAELEAGTTNKDAAWRLGISEKTLEHHLGAIYRRLGVSSRSAALHRVREGVRRDLAG